jgi:hypothetical protein
VEFDGFLEQQRDDRQRRQQRRRREGTNEVVLVVQDLDVQRQRVGLAADVPAHDRHRAEFAHRPRVAQNHAVDHAPADFRQRDARENLQAAGAQGQGRLFLVAALRQHDREHLTRHQREGDEGRGDDDTGYGEDDLDVVSGQQRAEHTLRAEQQHEDQPGNDGRHAERQIDERDQRALAPEVVTRHEPGRRDTKQGVERHRDRCREQGELNGGQSLRQQQRRPKCFEPLGEGGCENHRKRQQQSDTEKQPSHSDQEPAHQRAFLGHLTAPARRCDAATTGHAAAHVASALRAQRCSRLMPSRSKNDAPSMTVAIAVAPA